MATQKPLKPGLTKKEGDCNIMIMFPSLPLSLYLSHFISLALTHILTNLHTCTYSSSVSTHLSLNNNCLFYLFFSRRPLVSFRFLFYVLFSQNWKKISGKGFGVVVIVVVVVVVRSSSSRSASSKSLPGIRS